MSIVITGDELQNIWMNLDSVGRSVPEGCTVDTRHVEDMREFYLESNGESLDQVVYEVFGWPESGDGTDLLVTVTILYPGMVGDEHFHTKGHFHHDPDGPEFIVGYQGTGVLQTGDRMGHTAEVEVVRGTHVWIPLGTAHRVINRSNDPVVYLSVSAASVGHDYDSVVQLRWKRDS